MSLLNQLTRLIKDPPPSHLFELSEAGLAFAHNGQTGFEAFEPGSLVPSPVEDNILRADAILSTIHRLGPAGAKKRKPAAVILPDYAARVSVLDFDSFPAAAEEQASLVRFRVKKTIPFDIDSAAVSYFVQPGPAGQKKVEVLAVTVALEVIARYEALFRSAGYHPGVVTTSAISALNLYKSEGIAVFAKLSGRALTVAVIQAGVIKLFRCVTIEETTEDEILAVLHPTFAYVEDELKQPVGKLVLCGIPQEIATGLKCEAELLRSRFGAPGPHNAGLLGYLEQVAH